MPVDSSQQFAAQLAAAKHQRKRTAPYSFARQYTITVTRAQRLKAQLSAALEHNDTQTISRCVEQLMALRAEQIALQLRQREADGEHITDEVVAMYTTQYYHDCESFLSALDEFSS